MDSATKVPSTALDWAKRGFELLKTATPALAGEAFRRAIEASPHIDFYHFGLGEALRRAGDLPGAEAALRRAVALNPGFADGHLALGQLLLSRGVPRAALGDLERAVVAAPGNARAWLGLAIARLGVGAPGEAEDAARRSLALKDDDVEAWGSLAIALAALGRRAEADAAFLRALSLGRAAFGRLEDLAASLHNMGRPAEALLAFRRLAQDDDWARRSMHKLFEVVLDCPQPDMAASQAERRAWGRRMVDAQPIPPHDNDPSPDRRLRLGFVGSVFCTNSSRHLIMPLLRAHDRKRYEIRLYSNTRQEDGVTAEYRRLADEWRVIRALDRRAAARMIRDDAVDILIDLNGLSEDHRLDIFAAKPAPVQISAWGYPSGTGLATVDALFTDAVSVRADEDRHFAEKIVRLSCWSCFDPDDVPRVEERPAASDPVFGALTRIRKLTDPCLDAWAELLARVPGARLLIKDFALDDPQVVRRVEDAFLDRGIGKARLELVGSSSRSEHLKTLGRIDVALSPFPHAGGTTTFEALALGLPVVALGGATIAERNSTAILAAVGRREWIGENVDDYVAIAMELAADRGRLATLRHDLPTELRQCAACNPALYMIEVDRAYRALWRAWCESR